MNNVRNGWKYTPVEAAVCYFNVAGGGAGWVDTDVSAAMTYGLAVIMCQPSAAQPAGARASGTSVDPKKTLQIGVLTLAGIARVSAGHVDLYRDAADNGYHILGYFS
jgi:hypothetical protein